MTTAKIDLNALASRLVHFGLAADSAARPIDRRLASAKFDGMAEALDALGLAPTPFAVRLAFIEACSAVEAARGPRPAFRAVGNQPLRDWDAAVAADVVARLA